jgi:hypothetical protein
MTLSHDTPLTPDLQEVAAELDAGRAVPSPEEAGRIHARVGMPRRSATRGRVAIASLLATGMLMSGGGAALALSGESSHGNASAAGYSLSTSAQPQVLGETQGTTPTVASTPTTSEPGTTTNAPPQVEAARQVASSNVKSLPFTGFAAIPIILAGIAMLVGGAWLRRRTLTN